MSVFELVSVMSDNNLEQESDKESEVGQNADIRIFFNDKLLAEEQGKDHRNGDSCGIIQRVK